MVKNGEERGSMVNNGTRNSHAPLAGQTREKRVANAGQRGIPPHHSREERGTNAGRTRGKRKKRKHTHPEKHKQQELSNTLHVRTVYLSVYFVIFKTIGLYYL